MITSSAPGKIILFGEHAVVYGQPALAVPVTQLHADVRIEEIFSPGVWINAPNIQLHSRLDSLAPSHPLAATVKNTLSTLGVSYLSGISILIRSSIPVASGLGSGAAVSVALIRALARYVGRPLTDEQVSALAFETEKLYHGTPSGIDNTVVAYAKPVYFVKDQPPAPFRVGQPFTIVIGDTGIAAPTKETVADVRRLWQENPARFATYFETIGSIVQTARQLIEAGLPDSLGPLMDENHALLRQMNVSSPALERLVSAARAAGALGAKLSGGGRGGNMIALTRPEMTEAVTGSLKEAGAKQVIQTQVE